MSKTFLKEIKNSYFKIKKNEQKHQSKGLINYKDVKDDLMNWFNGKIKFLKLNEQEKDIFINELIKFVKKDIFANQYNKYYYAKHIYNDLIDYGDCVFYDKFISKLTINLGIA